MNEFYKTGDCEGLITAETQIKNKEKWEEEAKLGYWKSVKEALIDKINQLWKRSDGKVDFYEEDWFPGYNLFLKDLQANGYYVYEGKETRKNPFAYDTPQKRFIISLYKIEDPYGVTVIREVNKDA